MRIAALLAGIAALVALASACKDGVTPDCTTDPTVCAPAEGFTPATTPTDSGSDAGSDAAAPSDAAADAADASG